MRRVWINILIFCGLTALLTSCDPDVANEKITLPDMNFNISLSPDTTYLKVGDTLYLRTSLNRNYAGNDIHLTGGEPLIGVYVGYFANSILPITNTDSVSEVYDGIDYDVFINKGRLKYNSTVQGLLLGFIPVVNEDSFVFDAKIVFNKKGLFGMEVNSSFYESNQGKARTNAKFIADNLNWDFYNFSDTQNPTPIDEKYYRRYSIAVTE